MMTDAMQERVKNLGGEWKEKQPGYYYLKGNSRQMGFTLIYIAIPEDHPLVGTGYGNFEDYGPEVNGGLTFSNHNVFGWDYGHAYNSFNFEEDWQAAYEYFKEKLDSRFRGEEQGGEEQGE